MTFIATALLQICLLGSAWGTPLRRLLRGTLMPALCPNQVSPCPIEGRGELGPVGCGHHMWGPGRPRDWQPQHANRRGVKKSWGQGRRPAQRWAVSPRCCVRGGRGARGHSPKVPVVGTSAPTGERGPGGSGCFCRWGAPREGWWASTGLDTWDGALLTPVRPDAPGSTGDLAVSGGS